MKIFLELFQQKNFTAFKLVSIEQFLLGTQILQHYYGKKFFVISVWGKWCIKWQLAMIYTGQNTFALRNAFISKY